ncbi:phosphonate ABC transporter, permease protein PhnE [Actinokineospora inagensis]|uniref:phosphonate ABC transporter, permease protein PhnE n=1 Tax=Actinokineospora inagensis TaxID=103730 RepID=UPI00042A0B62|nr:phosphonate ABC transporter, permease protein PhnE [Actinokineospora inagensis]
MKTRKYLTTFGIVAALAVAHVFAWRGAEISPGALADGWHGMARFLGEAVPPDLDWATVVQPGLEACLVTLAMGLLGTTLSVPIALALAVLGTRGRNPVVFQLARGIMSLLRATPEIVFGLIFVTAVGLGPFAGVLALLTHNIGVMGKLWSEAMDEVDPGPADALRVSGANGAQVVANAVLPAVVPALVGLLLYRLDVNVRSSLTLGVVGAGGIGFLIYQSIQLFQFKQMATYILMVLVVVIVVDLFSAAVRRRLAR